MGLGIYEFLESDLVQNLKEGKLPKADVDVEVTETSLINIGITVFLAVVMLILAYKLINRWI